MKSFYTANGQETDIKAIDNSLSKAVEESIASLKCQARKRPYWILHLDCGRKYFSVANIKSMLDTMALKGLNQLQLHFSESNGLRFALDDMTVVTEDGVEYDLSVALTTTGYLTQANMDDIIQYATAKSIDIVPSFDMPGHMTNIINHFAAFRYRGSAWALNCTDDDAVKFGLAIIDKYARYFASRGCKFWNIGADEVGPGGNGRWSDIPADDVPYFVRFINLAAAKAVKNGLIPRIFNDGALYDSDYDVYLNRNIQIYYWSTLNDTKIQSAQTLAKNGFSLINTNSQWYFIIPTSNNRTSNSIVENANILKSFASGNLSTDQDGACICVWCDSDNTNDGGDAALSCILADIASLGVGIGLTTPNIDYPIIT